MSVWYVYMYIRIVKDGLEDAIASKLYVTSVYWTVTTLSTVGYGDIFASTIAERTYCILVSVFLAWRGMFFSCVRGMWYSEEGEEGVALHMRRRAFGLSAGHLRCQAEAQRSRH